MTAQHPQVQVDPATIAAGLNVESTIKSPENEADQKHRHKTEIMNWWFDRVLLVIVGLLAVICIFFVDNENVKRGGFTLLGVVAGAFAGAVRAGKK